MIGLLQFVVPQQLQTAKVTGLVNEWPGLMLFLSSEDVLRQGCGSIPSYPLGVRW
jgi:hypothetical protein